MKIVSWNVNGIRARQAEVQALIEREQPDVLCLQELKAAIDQLPIWLADLEGYWCYWHGGKGYSGVGLHVRKAACVERPDFQHPDFDYEHRIVVAAHAAGDRGVDLRAERREGLPREDAVPRGDGRLCRRRPRRSGAPLILCGDLNVARTDMDVHPKERKAGATGQRPEERALIERIAGRGLVDVHRALHPDDADLFTWWAPWRNLRQRNIGWRIDYILATRTLAVRASSCAAQRETGTSDHAPVVAVFDL